MTNLSEQKVATIFLADSELELVDKMVATINKVRRADGDPDLTRERWFSVVLKVALMDRGICR